MKHGLWIAVLLLSAATSFAAEVDYERDVKPLLREKCGSCHGPLAQEAGLRLDAAVLIRKGSDTGQVVSPGHPETSLLIERISADDAERMPPEGVGDRLTEAQSQILKAWISAGMPAPEDETYLSGPEEHWAFQPIVRPPVPESAAHESNPIDAFIAADHARLGLRPAPQADPATLIRRATFDLIGLPPTESETQAFLEDGSDEAYRALVDRLLASPQHGERWGRHWMDVWRYSDWDGFKNELRGSQRHIWQWRDWIVESLNADKPYDRMVVEMLAADEVAPLDQSALRATGFLARNYHNSNRDIWLDATVEHTAKAFLGLTIDCARCHDHKYDPISQREYYAFRAIFEPHKVRMDRLAAVSDGDRREFPRAYDADLNAETFLYIGGNEKQPDKEKPIAPSPPAVVNVSFDVQPIEAPLAAYAPAAVDDSYSKEAIAAEERALNLARLAVSNLFLQQEVAIPKRIEPVGSSWTERGELIGPAPAVSQLQRAELDLQRAQARLESVKARWAADLAKYRGADASEVEALAKKAAAAERHFNRWNAEFDLTQKHTALVDAATKKSPTDDAKKPLADARAKLTEAIQACSAESSEYTPAVNEYPRTSTGRRTALARWIVDPQNPLTARVAINHIWMRHFGQPLSVHANDFGLRAPKPAHADLLDWLAAELIDSGWSMKHIHRLIVTSKAYKRASTMDAETYSYNSAIDPDNQHYWRGAVRRLEAEAIRDSLLQAAGVLDLTLGGPDIPFEQGETTYRRSLYFQHANEKQMLMLLTFDAASPTECYRRSTSVVPQQALALANSGLAVSASRWTAQTIARESGADIEDEEFVRVAYLRLLNRPPHEQELADCKEFIARQTELLSSGAGLTTFDSAVKAAAPPSDDPRMRALESLIHVLINHNDFVTVR